MTTKTKLARLPKVGDRVELRKAYKGFKAGRVVDVVAGCRGPILGLHLDGYDGATVDTHWKKVRPAPSFPLTTTTWRQT